MPTSFPSPDLLLLARDDVWIDFDEQYGPKALLANHTSGWNAELQHDFIHHALALSCGAVAIVVPVSVRIEYIDRTRGNQLRQATLDDTQDGAQVKARGEWSDFYCHMHPIDQSPRSFLEARCRNVIRYNGRQSRHTLW